MKIEDLLIGLGLKPSKRFGQNFLIDNTVAYRVSRLIRLGTNVLEVGAGTGVLTEKILDRANRMVVFESNGILADYLAKRFGSKLVVRHEDFLKAEVPATELIVSSVPYTVSTPFMIKLFNMYGKWNEAILILQEEFVQKLCATAGASNYRRISVLAQYAWKIGILDSIPKGSFYPEPRVNSLLVKLVPNNTDQVIANKLKVLTGMLFSYRNRTLRAALKRIDLPEKHKIETSLNSETLNKRVSRLEVPVFEKIAAIS
jgi:ribosomal RNA small subunit methyltransferase A